MTDVAYANALHRRDEISKQINAMQDSLAALKREAERVDRFLREWEEFASIPIETEHTENIITAEDSKPVDNPEKASGNPPKEEIGRFARGLIEDKGAPVSRNALFAALDAAGINLRGSDPKMVLSTMMWRLSRPNGEFVRLGRAGYWLRNRPYPSTGYVPGAVEPVVVEEADDLMDIRDQFASGLAEEIESANVAYHRDDAPTMSDSEYDRKRAQLAEIEGRN